MKKIITIIGARPQIIKSSAISRAIRNHFSDSLKEIIVHTGQHYDNNMSDIFFNEMQIPFPDYNLNVGSGSHGSQTGKMLEGLEEIFIKEKPDGVLVYGDTNSTIAGALAAVKIHIPVIHVEAGLRSFNKRMPEEINRISCDHMSTMLFCPTISGVENLKNEGFDVKNHSEVNLNHPVVYHCGDIMFDNSLFFSTISEDKSTIINDLNLKENEYILTTIHRDANTDIAENLENIFKSLLELVHQYDLELVFPVHPRTKGKMKELLSESIYHEISSNSKIKLIEPAGFLDIIALEKNARIIVTDSGGLQKESYFFKKPCVILRPQTEWVEIVNNGNAVLADADPKRILDGFRKLMDKKDFTYPEYYGDGKASEFICLKITQFI